MKQKKLILPLIVLTIVFLYAAGSLIHYAVRSVSTRNTNEELQALYEQMTETMKPEIEQTTAPTAETPQMTAAPSSEPVPTATAEPKEQLPVSYQYIGESVLPEMAELYSRNPDTAAWLNIPGVVNLPVVHRDNSYYLNHDFYGKEIDSGTLFLDEAHPVEHDTQYMVVHGHNMRDGSMFGMLSHYYASGYMEEHPTVYFKTLYRQETYEVIGVLYLPASYKKEGYVQYTGKRKFQSADEFYEFAEEIRQSALYWKEGAQMLYEDALLALSTCHENSRIVVMCRRIEPKAD